MLHDGAGEQGAHGMASAHNLGAAQLLLQLLAGAEADALDDDVALGDAVVEVLGLLDVKWKDERLKMKDEPKVDARRGKVGNAKL